MIVHLSLGLVAGTLCALGGALKDSPHEGFKPLTFLRSPVVACGMGALSALWTDHPLLILAVAGSGERVVVEGYKILRQAMPGKFNWHGYGAKVEAKAE